jgi:hypothetical protein
MPESRETGIKRQALREKSSAAAHNEIENR